MALSPTHRRRTPYVLFFDGQAVALGDPDYLRRINDRLTEQGYHTRPTYWDQTYVADLSLADPEALAQVLEQSNQVGSPDQLNSVGVTCSEAEFWAAMYARSFDKAPAWGDGETLYMPALPDWLENTRTWRLDPLAPGDGPDAFDLGGGWVRVKDSPGGGQPIGLFQLTSADFFWAFGSAEDLRELVHLCRSLARDFTGFDRITAYLGTDLGCSSIRFPIECRRHLEEQLFLAGVDAETLFWEP